jgi:hypothetical protein
MPYQLMKVGINEEDFQLLSREPTPRHQEKSAVLPVPSGKDLLTDEVFVSLFPSDVPSPKEAPAKLSLARKPPPMTFIGELKSNMTLENWSHSQNDSSLLPRMNSKELRGSIRQSEREGKVITIVDTQGID